MAETEIPDPMPGATEPDEEQVLQELYGEPVQGIYSGLPREDR